MKPNHSYRIRPATSYDLPEIVKLDEEAFAPYGTQEDPKIFESRLAVFPEGFIVLESDGVLAAYGCSEKWSQFREPQLNEDPTTSHHPDGNILCITAMAVRLAFRGRGLGLAILDHFIDLARQHHCIQIIAETTHAQGLYQKRGFHTISEREQSGIVLSVMRFDVLV